MSKPGRDTEAPQVRPLTAPQAHDRCTVPGLYISACGCGDRVTMTDSMYFPSCIKCGKDVTWLLQQA